MNILRLIRFPVVCLVLSGILTGFYIVLFSGLGVEKIGYLPHVAGIGVCLIFASSSWNEMFNKIDISGSENDNLVPSKMSMSSGFVIASVLMIIAIMISMTVSLVTFFVVAVMILNSFLYNSLFKNIALLDPVFFALQFSLLLLLGMSAHSYLIYILGEPNLYIPVVFTFLYIVVLRVIRNVSVISTSEVQVQNIDDYEGESLELSTELDSVYPTHMDSERSNDYSAAKKFSDKMIQRNMNLILPSVDVGQEREVTKNTIVINGIWAVYPALIALLFLPIAFCWLNSFEVFDSAILTILLLFLAFPMFGVIKKRNITAIKTMYADGVASICLINAMVVVASSTDPFSKQTVAVVAIVAGLALPFFVMRKYFKKIV